MFSANWKNLVEVGIQNRLNWVADKLAKIGADQEDQMVSMMTLPKELKDLLVTYFSGSFSTRDSSCLFFFFRSSLSFLGRGLVRFWDLKTTRHGL